MSVYTELSHHEVEGILFAYSLGSLHGFEGIAAGIENSNFFVDTGSGRYVLTIFERVDGRELPYFMHLMRHLSKRGFPCPAVQERRGGSLLFELRGKQGCIVSRLPGKTVETLSESQLSEAGAMLARLHLAGAGFSDHRPDPTPLSWLLQTATGMDTDVSARYGDEAARLLEEELAWQEGHKAAGLPAGVIHADYFCDNILFSGDEVTGVIDFYYASDGIFAYDLAIAANALACRLQEDDEERMRILTSGYEQVRRLSDHEHAAWQGLLRLAALRFWVSRLHDALYPRQGTMVQVKDPEEYQRKLLFHRG